MSDLVLRENTSGRLDSKLEEQYNNEREYWRKVLSRVFDVVQFLAIRGLPFRGRDEKFGSIHNGNYLGQLEFLAKYDTFMKNHIDNYSNRGKGSVSYLSSTISDEFLNLIAKHVLKRIIQEVKANKYYSISVDSTPDISNIDQLTFILRYLNTHGNPLERFIKFIPLPDHTASTMEKIVVTTLAEMDLDIADCRSQSYDNASNMAGVYGGLQALIKIINELILFIPCSPHSLNLVGADAASCCGEATKFFMLVQGSTFSFTNQQQDGIK